MRRTSIVAALVVVFGLGWGLGARRSHDAEARPKPKTAAVTCKDDLSRTQQKLAAANAEVASANAEAARARAELDEMRAREAKRTKALEQQIGVPIQSLR